MPPSSTLHTCTSPHDTAICFLAYHDRAFISYGLKSGDRQKSGSELCRACLDQGSIVVFDEKHNPERAGYQMLPVLDMSNIMVRSLTLPIFRLRLPLREWLFLVSITDRSMQYPSLAFCKSLWERHGSCTSARAPHLTLCLTMSCCTAVQLSKQSGQWGRARV